jgi:hypothetical protein
MPGMRRWIYFFAKTPPFFIEDTGDAIFLIMIDLSGLWPDFSLDLLCEK